MARTRLPLLTLTALLLAAPAPTAAPASVTIKHDEGTTTVPLNPKRVVVLDEESLGFMTALGVPVVGLGGGRLAATDVAADGTLRPEVQRQGFLARSDLKGVQYVGSWVAPNFEKILALKPDLIVRLTWQGNTGYDRLSAIAPTLAFREDRPGYWKAPLRELARVFGRQELAERVIVKYNTALRADAAKLSQAGVFRKYPKAVVISPFPGGTVYINNAVRLVGISQGLGFKDGSPLKGTGVLGIGAEISKEALLGLPADTLVFSVPAGAADGQAFAASEVGQRLGGRLVTYALPTYSPWTGPLMEQQTAQDLTSLLLAKKF